MIPLRWPLVVISVLCSLPLGQLTLCLAIHNAGRPSAVDWGTDNNLSLRIIGNGRGKDALESTKYEIPSHFQSFLPYFTSINNRREIIFKLDGAKPAQARGLHRRKAGRYQLHSRSVYRHSSTTTMFHHSQITDVAMIWQISFGSVSSPRSAAKSQHSHQQCRQQLTPRRRKHWQKVTSKTP